VWLVPEGHEGALQTEVSLRNEGSAHVKHMPRGTVVVEVPASTTAAGKVKTPAVEVSAAAVPVVSTAFVEEPVTTEMATPAVEAAVEVVTSSDEGRFVAYRVPGADFVQPGMYRLNPYTVMVM
jgi:hypothetical protein